MKPLLTLALLTATALPATAQQAPTQQAPASSMSAAEFDAYTQGRTFTYGSQGAPYGAEEYLSNRRVRWSFLDGDCQEGQWYEENGLICFTYEQTPEPQCWSFAAGSGGGLTATFQGPGSQTELYEMQSSEEPLACPGPEIGV
ncbi:hypothetical protein [Pseudooceanicola marinus]|uniref:hypothetical protein n=1 Tax=Pseudooceanicola marinus TaxID=396013 RepID=UPI001CD4EBDC|nr:hypothetical protein [Pseudooceanicola marinus]MCA1336754.1 hypothetical protein [Pseudooceanicola marinus]